MVNNYFIRMKRWTATSLHLCESLADVRKSAKHNIYSKMLDDYLLDTCIEG